MSDLTREGALSEQRPTDTRILNEIEAIPIDIFEETLASYFQKVSNLLNQRRKR